MDKSFENVKGKAKKENKKDGAALLRLLTNAALYGFCGYLSGLCSLPFETFPMGVALLAACGKNAPFVWAGLIVASLVNFESGVATVFIGTYTALLLLRVLSGLISGEGSEKRTLGEVMSSLFCESVPLRALWAAVSAFGLSLAFLVGGGFLYYDLFGLIVSVLSAPIAACVISGAFINTDYQDTEKNEFLASLRRDAGILAAALISIRGGASLEFYGASLSVGGGIILVLLACKHRGFLRGVVCALCAGLVCSLSIVPVFLICAVCCGVFMNVSASLVSFSALAASLGYAFYTDGIRAFGGTVGGIVLGCLLFSVIEKLLASEKIGVKEDERSEDKGKDKAKDKELCKVLDESELDSVRLFDMNRRMAEIASCLANLSDLFEEMKLKFPRSEELYEICSCAFEMSCTGCAEQSNCRKNGYIDSEIKSLSVLLESREGVVKEDISKELSQICGRLPDIIDEINYNARIRTPVSCNSDKDLRGETLFSADRNYKALSGILGREMETEDCEYIRDGEKSELLCPALQKLDAGITGALVYGKRQKKVYIKGESRRLLESASEEIANAVEETLGIRVSRDITVRRCGRENEGSITLCQAPAFTVSCASRRVTKKGECYCGDSFSTFEIKDGKYFALLSDGMGSGRDAAAMSELTVGFMQNMLPLSGMNQEVLEMLNSCLRSRCDTSARECSATLDLMELDLISGKAVFFKNGAAPTYVYRRGNLFKLRSHTMPLGILDVIDTRALELELSEGDAVIMISDGVTGGKEECPYLFDLLKRNAENFAIERVADLIVKYAAGAEAEDDISVMVMKIGSCRS